MSIAGTTNFPRSHCCTHCSAIKSLSAIRFLRRSLFLHHSTPMPTPVLSMTQRLENASAIVSVCCLFCAFAGCGGSPPRLSPHDTSSGRSTDIQLGEYMLKGWTLTDLHCDNCRVTPLMREPAALARREHRPPTHFCAQCDGGPVTRPTRQISNSSASSFATASSDVSSPPATSHSSTFPSTPRRHITPPGTPSPSHQLIRSPNSPPGSHIASVRGDPDAAADAISSLLLRGYSLLSSTCPDPACRDVPLVGFPRRNNGSRDPRRECVSCGKRWVDEKDLAASGLRYSDTASASSGTSATLSNSSVYGSAEPETPRSSARRDMNVSGEPVRDQLEAESPRSKARRELYAHGASVMEERARNQAQKSATDEEPQAVSTRDRSSRQLDSTSVQHTVPPQARRPFVADEHRPSVPDGKLRVVLISSGSVASIKIPNIVAALGSDSNVQVQVIGTDASLYFYDKEAVEEQNKGVNVWRDVDEWSDWKKIGDPILHIELRRWADLVVVAPCSADMLAKIAGGICDNLPVSMDLF